VFSRFFIDRPIFASVLSIFITLGGGVALVTLPVAQYPDIAPPTVEVSASYPGANAKVVADTVAAPIEQQVNGVENMMYMSSQSNNDGSYSLTVTFKLGVDLDAAQVLVQNRVSQALPALPDVVKQTGVTVKKQSPSILLVVNLYSEVNEATGKPYYDQLYLSNFATIYVKDPLARVAYVDNDLVVASHARALLCTAPGVCTVEGDLRDQPGIVSHPDLLAVIDLSAPVGIVLGAVR